eukprot:173093-Prymnesium_polylepis.2
MPLIVVDCGPRISTGKVKPRNCGNALGTCSCVVAGALSALMNNGTLAPWSTLFKSNPPVGSSARSGRASRVPTDWSPSL